jgi:hypothetical protein
MELVVCIFLIFYVQRLFQNATILNSRWFRLKVPASLNSRHMRKDATLHSKTFFNPFEREANPMEEKNILSVFLSYLGLNIIKKQKKT